MKGSKKLLIFICSTFFICQTKANIDNLKGTYDILKNDYKHLSIIHGAIADEKDYLMRLYDYGSFGEEKDATDQAGAVHKIPDVTNAPVVVQLVHLFFNRNPGAMNRTDFVLTKSLRDATPEDKKIIVKALAGMIGIAQKITGKEPKKEIKAIVDRGLTKEEQDKIQLFKTFILDAYKEEKSDKAVFPENTTNIVLLGIVYRFASDDKNLLKIFYENLNSTIGVAGSIFVGEKIPDGWDDLKFDFGQAATIANKIKDVNIENIAQVVANFENIVYVNLLPGNYPPLQSYKTVFFNYDSSVPQKIDKFSDCMEQTFRNFFNILFYKKEIGGFDLNKIPGLNINQVLKEFYSKQSNAISTGDQAFHNAWTKVIENIPFTAYNRSVNVEIAAYGKKGFIRISEDVKNPERFNTDYKRVSQGVIAYEIQPSLKNIIVVVDYLLGLNLFEEEKIDGENKKIAQALLRPDFIKFYFPKMCEKIGVKLKPWDIDVDKQDYGMVIKTFLQVHPNLQATAIIPDVEFVTSQGHGEIRVLSKNAENGRMEFEPKTIFKIKDKKIYFLSAILLSNICLSYFSFSAILSELGLLIGDQKSCEILNALFCLTIEDSDFVKDFIQIIANSRVFYKRDPLHLFQNPFFNSNLSIFKLLRSLVNKIPDQRIKEIATIRFNTFIALDKQWNPESGIEGFPRSNAKDLSQSSILSDKSWYGFPDVLHSLQNLKEALKDEIVYDGSSSEIPSLPFKNNLIRLKAQLTELKNKLKNLSQKLGSLKQKLAV